MAVSESGSGSGGCSSDDEEGSDEDAVAGEGGSHERPWPEAR